MDIKNFTWAQWINVAIFALVSVAAAGWWQDFVTPKSAAAISGGLAWVGSVLNFVLTGKPAEAAPPAAPAP